MFFSNFLKRYLRFLRIEINQPNLAPYFPANANNSQMPVNKKLGDTVSF